MIYALNMLGTILNATNGLVLAGMVGFILAKDGIAYRRWLWFAFIYPFLQGVTACTVFLNIYNAEYPTVMAVCRFLLGLTGQTLTVIVGIYLRDFISFLREAYDTQKRLEDDRANIMLGANAIVEISRSANKQQDEHLALLQRQGASIARHA